MHTEFLSGIADALAALDAACDGRAPVALAPGELLAVNAAFGALKRHVEAAFAHVAAEISRQSRVELGRDSLARKQGFRTPVALIQATTGSTVGEAMKLVQVGEAMAPRSTVTGETLPAKHPHVAASVADGTVSVAASAAIVSLLERLTMRVDAEALAAAEALLVERAPGLRADELARLLTHIEARLDPDGVAPRHEERRAKRFLDLFERDGALHISGVLDIETGAPIKAAVEGRVTAMMRAAEHGEHEEHGEHGSTDLDGDDASRDDRSTRQKRADALADICAHATGCRQMPTETTATVVVRVTLDDLRAGTGLAVIDGIDAPLPVAALRRMACDAAVIPWVMGSDSEVLDWGREKRLFTRAQKLALAERDRGCACCGAPVAWTHVHHIEWWRAGGPTDLSNGVLLCSGCHHRLHDDGWEVQIDGKGVTAKVWFIPPPWIDPQRRPRPAAGRLCVLAA